jgi:hypothetical protein
VCNCDQRFLCANCGCATGYTDDGVRVCYKNTCQCTYLDCFGSSQGKRQYICQNSVCASNICCCCKYGCQSGYDFSSIHLGCSSYNQYCCYTDRCALLPDEATPFRLGCCGKQFYGKQAVWNGKALKLNMTNAKCECCHLSSCLLRERENEEACVAEKRWVDGLTDWVVVARADNSITGSEETAPVLGIDSSVEVPATDMER